MNISLGICSYRWTVQKKLLLKDITSCEGGKSKIVSFTQQQKAL